MSLISQTKVCPICGRKYSFNPDIGKTFCPHCGNIDKSTKNGIIKTKSVKLKESKVPKAEK